MLVANHKISWWRLLQKPWHFTMLLVIFWRDLAPDITIKRTSKQNQKNLQKWTLDQLKKLFIISHHLTETSRHLSETRISRLAWFKATVAYFQSCRFPKPPSKRVKSCQLGFPIQSMSYPYKSKGREPMPPHSPPKEMPYIWPYYRGIMVVKNLRKALSSSLAWGRRRTFWAESWDKSSAGDIPHRSDWNDGKKSK